MKHHDFLVEIGTEELPPKSLWALAGSLREAVASGLATAGLGHGALQAFATPRRLAVLVRRLAVKQREQQFERRGPPVSAAFDANGQPTRAAFAFAESCGVALGALSRVTEAKGEFLFCSVLRAGTPAAQLLPGVVQRALDQLPIARRMRWGAGQVQFVRPVHWVVMLHGADVVACELLGQAAGRTTRGHRFHAPKPILLRSPGGYVATLEKRGHVIADFAARREQIRAGVIAAATAAGGEALIDAEVLHEVTALVEWPVPIVGTFEARFLELPPEVLIATLQDHQRYFPVRSSGGALLPLFVAVANIESRDPAQVRAGNERVVRPRLADATFFYAADRRTPLESRRTSLASVTFQARLGSLADKSARITALAAHIAAQIGGDVAAAQRAAQLAKCDLLTNMVGEFPGLQGIMGQYYAIHGGEPAAVAAAIAEQYLPRFAGDALPVSGAGLALAIADKLDTIVGSFAIGQKPTGARDPFGLRRSALGVLRILIETRVALDLRELIALALDSVRADMLRFAGTTPEKSVKATVKGTHPFTAAVKGCVPFTVAEEVYDYMMERLRAWYLEGVPGVTSEMFDAVLDTRPASPLDFDDRLRALLAFLALPDAASLTAANKRIGNILRKAADEAGLRVNAGLLSEPAERQLAADLEKVRPDVEALLESHRYSEAMQRLATLRASVDSFFDQVMVMADDPAVRANRLALLAALQRLFQHTANLSRLPG